MPGASSALNQRASAFGRCVVVDWQQRLGLVGRLGLLERYPSAFVVHNRLGSERLSLAAR